MVINRTDGKMNINNTEMRIERYEQTVDYQHMEIKSDARKRVEDQLLLKEFPEKQHKWKNLSKHNQQKYFDRAERKVSHRQMREENTVEKTGASNRNIAGSIVSVGTDVATLAANEFLRDEQVKEDKNQYVQFMLRQGQRISRASGKLIQEQLKQAGKKLLTIWKEHPWAKLIKLVATGIVIMMSSYVILIGVAFSCQMPEDEDGYYGSLVSGSGQAVVDFACQFVGNPYVWGGTSLTNGADCSGFIMSVYKNFGVDLPHSSKAMRQCGIGVTLEDALPGDIVCYDGHVAIYMGNNYIIHAANKRDGIKISKPADYRTILTIRRVLVEQEERENENQ